MCNDIDQPFPGCGEAQSRLSFWQAAGARKTSTRVAVADLWEEAVKASLPSAFRNGLGLPRPGVARIMVRLTTEGGCSGHAKKLSVALRYARIVARHAHEPAHEAAVPVQGSPRGVRLLRSELAEINLAWPGLLRAGACTILADRNGNLRPAALRELAQRLKSSRQGRLFHPRESAEAVIRDLAAAVGRPRGIVEAN